MATRKSPAKTSAAGKTTARKQPAAAAKTAEAVTKPAARKRVVASEPKPPAAPKPASKPAVEPQPPAREPAAAAPDAVVAKAPSAATAAPDGEVRYRWIAHAAYLRAERRGFAPGHEVEDWLAAEAEFLAAHGLAPSCPGVRLGRPAGLASRRAIGPAIGRGLFPTARLRASGRAAVA